MKERDGGREALDSLPERRLRLFRRHSFSVAVVFKSYYYFSLSTYMLPYPSKEHVCLVLCVRLVSAQIYHTKRMQRVFAARYSMDAAYVLSGSDDFNLRLWKAHAAEKLGIVTPRERKHIAYMGAVKERYTLGIETQLDKWLSLSFAHPAAPPAPLFTLAHPQVLSFGGDPPH